MDRFDAELARLKYIFPTEKIGLKAFYIAGNHDIGFGKHGQLAFVSLEFIN
jgi:hypothetical protein